MNSKSRIFLTICVCLWVAMMTIYFILGDFTIAWGTILPTLLGLVLFAFILGVSLGYQRKKIYELISDKKYDAVIKKMNRIRYSNIIINQMLFLNVSVMFLHNNDIDNFYVYINKVNHKNLMALRFFWEAVKYLKENDRENAEKVYALFLDSPPISYRGAKKKEFYDAFISGCISFYDGNKKDALYKLSSVYEQLNSPITKKLCEDIFLYYK